MHQIESSTSTLDLKVNDEAYYQGSVHASVGSAVEMQIDDESVIKITTQKLDYENPSGAQTPGGDAATKTFVLKTLSPGTAKITIRNTFRGEVKSEQVIDCVVSAE